MRLRKVFAGIAAAATMLGGLALGATTANAAPADAATITVHNAQAGHTYTAYKFAEFSNAQTVDGKVNVDVATLTTSGDWNTALENAVTAANLTAGAEYAGNYAAYVATLTPAQLRTVVDQLAVPANAAAADTDTPAAADGDAVLDVTEGWYIVQDTYTKDGAEVSAPLAVVASTLSGDAAGLTVNTPDGQHDIAGVGEFNSKSEDHVTPTPD